MLQNTEYALVTGGGTTVAVDAVRTMSNGAKGRFAVEIAAALVRRGIRCVLILSEAAHLAFRDLVPKGVEVVTFRFFAEYQAAIAATMEKYGPPAYAFSVAAVSDYGFLKKPKGKIRSDHETLTLVIPRLPKVLDGWRAQFGRQTVIVGFKLLSMADSSFEDLVAAARKQDGRAHLNATVANFLEEVNGGLHPCWWVTPDGGAVRLNGFRHEVADQIVTYAVRYRRTTWANSERVGDIASSDLGGNAALKEAYHLLAFGQEAQLLTGDGGNVIVPQTDGSLWVTPRGVDKSKVLPEEFLLAVLEGKTVRFWGRKGQKPSIDTYVHALLDRDLPRRYGALHFHGGWVLGNHPVTRLAYPCGAAEQAGSIREAIAAAGIPLANRLMVELRDHGHILFLDTLGGPLNALCMMWADAEEQYRRHLLEVGHPEFIEHVRLSPVFYNATIVGVAARRSDSATSFFLLPAIRGKGFGDELVALADARGTRIIVHDNCGVFEYYVRRGFQPGERNEALHLTVLLPPTHRTDLLESASVVVYSIVTDKVLLLRRGEHTAYPGLWAHPGGRRDVADHDAFSTALRELREETGYDAVGVPEPDPRDISVHYTGWTNPQTGENRGYRVTNYVLRLLRPFEPVVDGVEIAEARWVSHEETTKLPMGPATRAALRKIWP